MLWVAVYSSTCSRDADQRRVKSFYQRHISIALNQTKVPSHPGHSTTRHKKLAEVVPKVLNPLKEDDGMALRYLSALVTISKVWISDIGPYGWMRHLIRNELWIGLWRVLKDKFATLVERGWSAFKCLKNNEGLDLSIQYNQSRSEVSNLGTLPHMVYHPVPPLCAVSPLLLHDFNWSLRVNISGHGQRLRRVSSTLSSHRLGSLDTW